MWRCGGCNLVWDDEAPPAVCPQCEARQKRFVLLDPAAASRIEEARFGNSLLMQLHLLLEQVQDVAEDGLDEELDPGCARVFGEAALAAERLQPMIKAEIQAHVGQGRWG